MVLRVIIIDERPLRSMRLRHAISADKGTHLVGAFRTFQDAGPVLRLGRPDVVIADLGFSVSRELRELSELARQQNFDLCPIDAMTRSDDADPVEKLRAFIRRPTATKAAAPPPAQVVSPPRDDKISLHTPIIALGASTGGVDALTTVLSGFPEDCPPTLVVQHIRHDFTQSFVDRLNKRIRPNVQCATDGSPLAIGTIIFAPGADRHLELSTGQTPHCVLRAGPPVSGHQPSVDALFKSIVPHVRQSRRVCVALMTGMGRDGAEGLLQLRRAGAQTIAQDKESSVVWGMPRVATENGGACEVLSLHQIGPTLLRRAAEPTRARATQ